MKILAISDMHGYLPDIPDCDILIIAGDICPDFSNVNGLATEKQLKWLKTEYNEWCKKLVGRGIKTIATWGNHDFVGQELDVHNFSCDCPYAEVGADEEFRVEGLKVWVTPWVTKLPFWAFNGTEATLDLLYCRIPEGIDILVTHAPPYGYGDVVPGWGHVGTECLLKHIERIKPKAVFCGHIHPAYGKYDLDGVPVYNVACVDDDYQLVRGATEIEWTEKKQNDEQSSDQ